MNNLFLKLKRLYPFNKISLFVKNRFYEFGKTSIIYVPYKGLMNVNMVSIGNNTIILSESRFSVYGKNINEPVIIIGDGCYIGYNFSILAYSKSKIVIGNDVLIASYVLISNENHGMNPESNISYMNQELNSDSIEIGDGCWIGEKVVILPGVKIGKKCIIGASSVVNKSIPDYCIAVGNPCKIVKRYNFINHMWEKCNVEK